MKIDPKIQYKSETGNSAYIDFESSHLTESLDSMGFEGMSGDEIRSALDYDCKNNAGWGIFIKDIPVEFTENDCLIIPSPEYVEWLESKLSER